MLKRILFIICIVLSSQLLIAQNGWIYAIAESSTSDVLPGGGTFTATGPVTKSCSPNAVENPVSCSISNLPVGTYTVSYTPPSGWVTDDSPKTVTVTAGNPSTVTIHVHKPNDKGWIYCIAESSTSDELLGGGTFNASGPSSGSCSPPTVSDPVQCTISNLTAGIYTVSYTPPSGWVTDDSPKTVTVTAGNPSTVTIHVHKCNCIGELIVTIQPQGARDAGAQWRVDGGDWRNSGTSVIIIPGNHTVSYKDIPGWEKPDDQVINVSEINATQITGTYIQKGELVVTIQPQEAINAGAQWRVDGGEWRNSEDIVNLSLGQHTITYKDITNWITPVPQNVNIDGLTCKYLTGTYIHNEQLSIDVTPKSAESKQGESLLFNLMIRSNSNLIAGATITVIDPFKTNNQTVYSDINGKSNYTLSIPYDTQPAKYYISFKAEKDGYNPSENVQVEIRVIKGDDINIKIIGIMQNAHDNPSIPIGLNIIAKIPTSNGILECKFYWDNLDDFGCLEGIPQILTYLGDGYYKISITEAFPWICGFSPGNRIRWRIQAKDNQNNSYYYPPYQNPFIYDTTAIYSYAQLNSNLQITNGISGFVATDVTDNNSISIKNNKAVNLYFYKLEGPSFSYTGDYLAEWSNILSAKGFPFGFLDPPALVINDLTNIQDKDQLKIAFSKFGDPNGDVLAQNSAVILTFFDFCASISGVTDKIPGGKKAVVLFTFYEVLKDILLPVITDPSFKGWSYQEKITNLTLRIAEDFSEHSLYWTGVLGEKLLDRNLGYELSNMIASTLVQTLIPIAGGISKAISLINAGLIAVDFGLPPWNEDIVSIKKGRGHFIEITPLTLPGITGVNPILVATNSNYTFRVTNISNQRLYNVWIGLDIWAWDYSQNKYIKVENTKTDYVDPDTKQFGRIDFGTAQGKDLNPGESILLVSNNYLFTTSVTGYQYSSTNIPYKYLYTAWSNGEPGQTTPMVAVNLSKDLISVPFYMSDNNPPNPPTLYKLSDIETDTTVYIYWQKNSADNDIVKYVIYSNNNAIDTLDELVCRTVLIKKQNIVQNIKVKAADIGGNESDWSNIITIGPITNKVEKPIITPVYQTFPPSISVTITSQTEGAKIYYTLNSTEPVTTSIQYSGPIIINSPSYTSNVILKAKAWKDGYEPSDTTVANYVYLPQDKVAKPLISPNSGTFPPSINVNISCATPDALIRYTIDGSDPTTSSLQYKGTLSIDSPPYLNNIILKVKAWKDQLNPSEIAVGNFIYSPEKVSNPIISPSSGSFPPSISVSLSCKTIDAIIRYTLDGSEPSDNSIQYTQPIIINSPAFTSNVILKAKAWEYSLTPSDISTAIYVLGGTCQKIEIGDKWNLISFYVIPPDIDMMSILRPLINEGSLVKVQDENGKAIEKVLGTWINNIGDWSPTEGYYLRANSSTTLSVSGSQIPLPFNIPLGNKWNIISYPIDVERNAQTCLQPLIDANALVKVQDEGGNAFEKILGNWINNIGNFKPGEGYYLRANQDIILQYPSGMNAGLTKKNNDQNSVKYYRSYLSSKPFLPMNIYMLLGDDKGVSFDKETEIGVYDGDVLCGATKICDSKCIQDSSIISLIASMDDPYTNEVDGFIPGHEINFRIKNSLGERELNVLVVPNEDGNCSTLQFQPQGTIVVKLLSTTNCSEEIILSDIKLFPNYPNPFNPSTRINYYLPKDNFITIIIYNSSGQIVKTLYNGYSAMGYHSLEWNSDNDNGNLVSSGIYFYQLRAVDVIQNKKLLLLK